MIAADTNSFIDLFDGRTGPQVDLLVQALRLGSLAVPPPVETELLSFQGPVRHVELILGKLNRLPIRDGYWERAGANRRLLLRRRLKAKLADALIAQCCIDTDVPLITRDADFRHFAEHCGLKLAAALK